jgi:hypothetical protein
MPDAQTYDRNAIFADIAPIDPYFMHEAVRTLMRALPIDEQEPEAWRNRRMAVTLNALAALHPRDEIEVLLGVQSLCAFHAAAVCWHLGMNHNYPRGSGLRQFSAAASAARTFDTLLKALERRQAKPLAIPPGRPEPREWTEQDRTETLRRMQQRCAAADAEAAAVEWTPEGLALADECLEKARVEWENEGLDIANTEGILPGGGMIVPDDPDLHQQDYLGRRMMLDLRRKRLENLRNGNPELPKIQPVRPGDLVR